MQLVLDTNGLVVKKKNDAFWVIGRQARRIISPHRIDSIAVTADCLLSTAAIKLAARHQIPIFFFDKAMRLQARTASSHASRQAKLRRQQCFFALTPEATGWVIHLLQLKTQHQVSNLKFLKNRKPGKAKTLNLGIGELAQSNMGSDLGRAQPITAHRARLMGQEGNLARQYWQMISLGLPAQLQFKTRSRRPATDPFNAALNYLYGMLYGLTGSAVLAAGLDQHLGMLHADAVHQPTLVFDMVEPFRPWVDRLLLQEALKGKLLTAYFDQQESAYFINKTGKHYLIPLFNEWMAQNVRFRHHLLSRKNHIYRFAGEFSQLLLQEDWLPKIIR